MTRHDPLGSVTQIRGIQARGTATTFERLRETACLMTRHGDDGGQNQRARLRIVPSLMPDIHEPSPSTIWYTVTSYVTPSS